LFLLFKGMSLSPHGADAVISCGSTLAGVNYYLAKTNQARSVIIQKPGIWPIPWFHTVFLPYHDISKTKPAPNIVVTMGAPNIVTEEYLKHSVKTLTHHFSHLKMRSKKCIGLFIGGDSKHIFISENQVKVLAHQLKEILRDFPYEVLITTSRRTPERIERILHNEFKKDPNCPLLILANQQNVSEAVGGILELSDIVIASGDSISMVSEAATSGKTTIVFLAQKKITSSQSSTKHARFINRLHDQGYVLATDVGHLGETIYSVIKGKVQTKPLDDNAVIHEDLRRIF